MRKVTFYSLVVNNGDGSASVLYFANKEMAKEAYKAEEDFGEHFSDGEPVEEHLNFTEDGILLTPDKPRDYS